MTITRFAPSPTGYLHIGGLRTALYCYLWARKNNGEFKLRIEDTDTQRNNEDAMKAIINAFEWLGLDYDGEVQYQSKRLDIYKKYIQQLLDEGKAYYCYMSKDELDDLRQEQTNNKQTPRYDGRYRDFKGTIPKDTVRVVRIKAPLSGDIIVDDGIKSIVKFSYSQIDDFIIARSNGMPTYNFVVTIDDYLMNISHVIRGDDHLINTPKQMVIYKALGFDIPKFFHVPMINNPQGKKLSKRDGALNVMEYKKQGYLPHALLNFLVRLGWSNKDQEIFSMQEMLNLFDPSNINKSASIYNESKLLWLNAHYIKNMSNDDLVKELEYFDCFLVDNDKKDLILDLCKQRVQTLVELKHSISLLINEPNSYEQKGVKKFIKDTTIIFLNKYLQLLEKEKNIILSSNDFESISQKFIKEEELNFPQFFQPIRLSLTGQTQAPSVYEIMQILGHDEVYARINKAVQCTFNASL